MNPDSYYSRYHYTVTWQDVDYTVKWTVDPEVELEGRVALAQQAGFPEVKELLDKLAR